MTSVSTAENGGIVSQALDVFKNVFPDYLDYRAGYNPNNIAGGNPQSYGYTPTDGQAQEDNAGMFGGQSLSTPAGFLVMGIGALVVLKIAKVI